MNDFSTNKILYEWRNENIIQYFIQHLEIVIWNDFIWEANSSLKLAYEI